MSAPCRLARVVPGLMTALVFLFALGPPAVTADGVALRLEPRVTPLSSYEFFGSIKISNRDVSFDVPAEYRESFSFWTSKMKGIVKHEKVEYITVTREPAEDGSVPFRRQLPRYDLEIMKPGKVPAILPQHVRQAITSKVWEGTLDQYGNVIAMAETSGSEDDSIKELSFPFLNYLFPAVDGPQDLELGEGFTTRTRGNLPTRLTVSGLENAGLILIRTCTLKEVGPQQATFDVAISFEADPDRPPSREKITYTISGSGQGEATFDLKKGVFTKSSVSSDLIIDFEAPLRKLNEDAEGFDPGLGTSRIELQVQMSGNQKVNRLVAESQAPAPPAN